MKKCPQCAEDVQDEAKVCRYCGHDFSRRADGTKQPANNGCLWALAIVFGLGALAYYGGQPTPQVAARQASDEAALKDAYAKRDRIEAMVKQFLKDPSSANFRHLPNGCGFVNSKNAFGGMTGDQGFLIDYKTTPPTVWLQEMGPRKFKRLWKAQCA